MTNTRSFVDDFRTIPDMLRHTVAAWPEREAFRQYDYAERRWYSITWRTFHEQVMRWRRAFTHMGLVKGERVAMLLTNCIDAVTFDEAALCGGLVPTPLHAIDTAGSSAYILRDSNARFLVTTSRARWNAIAEAAGEEGLPDMQLVVFTNEQVEPGSVTHLSGRDIVLSSLEGWLATGEGVSDDELPPEPCADDLAGFIYTSGTTGNPKGVMLTHRNVISNIQGVLKNLQPSGHETFLSFLPLSHTFERTTSYYLALGLGYTTAFNRSIANLQADFREIRPTVLMSVPRVYEMIYAKLQDGLAKKSKFVRYLFDWAVEVGWRRFCRENGLPVESSSRAWLDPFVAGFLDKKVGSQLRAVFGDRIHLYISGGAALSPAVARTFFALGVPIYQGYGMTETSPIISVNKVGHNHPNTVGPALPNIEVRLGEGDELQVRGPTVMKGYWNREEATKAIFTEDGWLRTGDVCTIYPDGNIRITGRIKEIIVTSTGEKVPPADLESAITSDRLFSQCMVVGDDRPFIAAVAVVNPDEFKTVCGELGLDPTKPESLQDPAFRKAALKRIKTATAGFPNYGVPRQVHCTLDAWTIDNGLLTPTLKMKRNLIRQRYTAEINALYDTLVKR